jgi:TonB family protein
MNKYSNPNPNYIMKQLLVMVMLIFSVSLFAQKTKKIVISKSDSAILEKYHVLKSDKRIMQGKYEKYYMFYAHILGESGLYNNNKRVGIWKYYDWDQKEYLAYDYTNDSIVSYKADTSKQIIILGDDTISDYAERPVLYMGSRLKLFNFVLNNMNYPEYAKDHWITGRVCVGVVVNEEGKPVDYFIDKSVDKSLDDEALRVIKKFRGQWIPAIYKGKVVKAVYIYPMNFKLQWDFDSRS